MLIENVNYFVSEVCFMKFLFTFYRRKHKQFKKQ